MKIALNCAQLIAIIAKESLHPMKYPIGTMIKVKPLSLFYAAAISLVLSGFIVSRVLDWPQLVAALWCSVSGVFLIYRFNDYIDQTVDFRFNLQQFFNVRFHVLFVLQFVLINVPCAYVFLSKFYFYLFVVMGVLGFMYSFTWKINTKSYRIKNVFLLKNIVIGLLWGSLILLGAGNTESDKVIGLFAFVSFQVLIGSMIRDIPDIEKDKFSQVKSLPVVLGKEGAFWAMHLLNVVSLLAAYLVNWNEQFVLLMVLVIMWRIITLIKLQGDHKSRLWSDTANLLTCSLICLILLIQRFYEIYS